MPLEYSVAVPVVPVKTAVGVRCVGINISLTGDSGLVTYYYQSYDSTKRTVDEKSFTEPLSTIRVEDPVNYPIVYAALKKRAYQKAVNAGYPDGGVVS